MNRNGDSVEPLKQKPDDLLKTPVVYSMKRGLQAKLLPVDQQPGLFELQIEGCINLDSSGYFETILADLLNRKCTNVILNFSDNCTCVDKHTWNVIAKSARRFKSINGNLCIVQKSWESSSVMPFNLDVDTYQTIADAIAHCCESDKVFVAEEPLQRKDPQPVQHYDEFNIDAPFFEVDKMDEPVAEKVPVPTLANQDIDTDENVFEIAQGCTTSQNSASVAGDMHKQPHHTDDDIISSSRATKKNNAVSVKPLAGLIVKSIQKNKNRFVPPSFFNTKLNPAPAPVDKPRQSNQKPGSPEKGISKEPDSPGRTEQTVFPPGEKRSPQSSQPAPQAGSGDSTRSVILFPFKNRLRAELIAVSSEPALYELQIEGTIDHVNVAYFDSILSDLLSRGCKNVILNFSGLTFASSAAWGVLASSAQRFKFVNGALCIINMSASVEESFRILQFDLILNRFQSLAEATASFKLPAADVPAAPPHMNVPHPEPTDGTLPTNTPLRDNNDTIKSAVIQINVPGKTPDSREKAISQLSIPEKIQRILLRYGPMSPNQIKKHLESEEFGSTKINRTDIKSIFSEMNLVNRHQIERFWRSL
jgi:anti-anti-sigma factor